MFPVNTKFTRMDLMGTNVMEFIPKMPDIPSYPKRKEYENLVENWFFNGLESFDGNPKKGVQTNQALLHISCVLRSFQPSHEHKIASAAFLLNEWFHSFTVKAK